MAALMPRRETDVSNEHRRRTPPYRSGFPSTRTRIQNAAMRHSQELQGRGVIEDTGRQHPQGVVVQRSSGSQVKECQDKGGTINVVATCRLWNDAETL